MRHIGVVTVGRSDYSLYHPILKKIEADAGLHLHLIVAGMHLSPEFGLTYRYIEEDGFEIGDRVELSLCSDSPEGISKSMGLGVIGFAQSYARFRPDLLVVLGDRFEMVAGVLAAQPFNIPLVHIHGGERTEGAMDDAFRHSITKLSHLHMVATEEARRRVIQLGEEPGRVTISGAPALDTIAAMKLYSRKELQGRLGLSLETAPLLVTFHPVTLQYEKTDLYIGELLEAIERTSMPVVFTYPNADTGGRVIIEAIEKYASTHSNCICAPTLGLRGYYSLMNYAAAMVGNSSSGIIEAASFELPVVNIGDRQKGRLRGGNVIDAESSSDEISEAIQTAIHPRFRAELVGMANPYGDGQAAERIVRVLRETELSPALIQKTFYDIEVETGELI
jgi:UDP-N-acetylglucosamine 2-epimerase (non-hydrolysing)/GDP/UDP-N,N'-diacetylbacillosamine 2-epimerase (hydrolysing)